MIVVTLFVSFFSQLPFLSFVYLFFPILSFFSHSLSFSRFTIFLMSFYSCVILILYSTTVYLIFATLFQILQRSMMYGQERERRKMLYRFYPPTVYDII